MILVAEEGAGLGTGGAEDTSGSHDSVKENLRLDHLRWYSSADRLANEDVQAAPRLLG
jgi:hypothetical protein